jgi:hypothetical protein
LVAAISRVSPLGPPASRASLPTLMNSPRMCGRLLVGTNTVADALYQPVLPPSPRPDPLSSSPSVPDSTPSVVDWSALSVAVHFAIAPTAGGTQPVDWSAFTPVRRTCLSVQEMRQSDRLTVVYHLVGDNYLFGGVSAVVFHPLVP